MKKGKRGLLAAIVVAFVLAFSFGGVAYAEDTRIEVGDIVINGLVAPKFGDAVNASDNTPILANASVAEGAVYRLSRSMCNVSKLIDDRWVIISSNSGSDATNFQEMYSEGTYRFSMQVRIDGANGESYKLANPLQSCLINGTPSEFDEGSIVYDTYSFTNVYFTFEIEKSTLPFSFVDNESYDYPSQYIGKPIVEKQLIALGGTENYTFRKDSTECPWLTVSPDGKISGTPSAVDVDKHEIPITCSDGENEITIVISVGEVMPQPQDRTVVSDIVINGLVAPKLGDAMDASR